MIRLKNLLIALSIIAASFFVSYLLFPTNETFNWRINTKVSLFFKPAFYYFLLSFFIRNFGRAKIKEVIMVCGVVFVFTLLDYFIAAKKNLLIDVGLILVGGVFTYVLARITFIKDVK